MAVVVLLVVLGSRLHDRALRVGDAAAWSELQSYASVSGPHIGSRTVTDPPCTFDTTEEYATGSAGIESTEYVSDPYGQDARGVAAAQLLTDAGWNRDATGTAATLTYFSGTKDIDSRLVFVAVEVDSAEDLEQDRSQFRVRYILQPKAC